MTYLDWAATAPVDPDVIEAYARAAVEYSGNPSSPYPSGKAARSALEDARARCAGVLGCRPEQLAFTSGGTEANTIVLISKLLLREPGTLLISGLEHPSVADTASILSSQGWKLKEISPDTDGRISPEKLTKALEKNPDTRLLAIMGVNN
ncbi:MAG: aminotransferase class V-fold PLP-dependent enzyme, partial [Spirochaetaceae bacterium]|nr:aminotransferase class V-fold PLP-dependent enzyme [Spirochaetaceae bacterium]